MSSRKNEKNGSTVATTYEFQFPQPKEKIPFRQYIFNPSEGTVFGRDASSWSKLLLFYVVFYAILAGLFAICMQGLLATLNDKEPKWKLDSSLIGTNPGLGFRPLARETERGSIIDFNSTKPETRQRWIDLLDDFLKPYFNKTQLQNQGRNQKHCYSDTKLDKNEVCSVNLENFGECSRNNSYGYNNSRPCVFLKLNKIFDWEPEYYDNPSDLPGEMPANLKTLISSLPPNERKYVWVSCKGLNSNDEDAIQDITYYPSIHGFASHFYPYKNTPDYLSPLVAAQINLKKFGEIVSVECRAWAKNIIYSGSLRDRKGSVTFQVMIDVDK